MKTLKHLHELAVMAVFVLMALLFGQCVTPINSSFESARTLDRGDVEITGGFARYSSGEGGETEYANSNITARAGIGVSDRVDLKLRYTRLMPPKDGSDENLGVNYLHLATKVGIIEDYLAISVPIGLYFKDNETDWLTSPKLLVTYPHKSNKFDATFGFKSDLFFSEFRAYLGFTLGMGFSTDLDHWAIRPEIGYMIDPGEAGHAFNWGVGLIYIFQKQD